MKGSFTANGGALVSAVHYASRWLDTKLTNPVLGGLVFAAHDGRVTIGSQGELATARAALEVEGDAEGTFIVSGRLLDALVSTLTDKPVTFEGSDSMITMTAGRYKAQLPAMSVSDYPALAEVLPTVGRVEGSALIDASRRAGTMSARGDTHGVVLTGIEVSFDDDPDIGAGDMEYTLTLAGTDRLRATRQIVEWQPGETAPIGSSFVVAASVMADAGEAFDGLPVDIGWQEGTVSLSNWSRSLVTRTLGKPGEFPPLAGLWGQINNRNHTVTLDTKTLVAPLKRADQLADGVYRHVALDLRGNVLTLRSSTGGKGDGGEEIDVEYDGPDCTIMTRSAMLHGLLSTAPGPSVVLHINPGEYLPVFATSPANPAWTHLFVPIRHT